MISSVVRDVVGGDVCGRGVVVLGLLVTGAVCV